MEPRQDSGDEDHRCVFEELPGRRCEGLGVVRSPRVGWICADCLNGLISATAELKRRKQLADRYAPPSLTYTYEPAEPIARAFCEPAGGCYNMTYDTSADEIFPDHTETEDQALAWLPRRNEYIDALAADVDAALAGMGAGVR